MVVAARLAGVAATDDEQAVGVIGDAAVAVHAAVVAAAGVQLGVVVGIVVLGWVAHVAEAR